MSACSTARRVLPGIVLALTVLHVAGCGRPTVTPMTMSKSERDALLDAQSRVDTVLREHSPFLVTQLAPPASEEELAALRAALGGVERSYVEIWYKWHNGGRDAPIQLLPLGQMLSVQESMQDRSRVQAIPFVHARRKRDIKLLEDGSGDGFFLDLVSSPPHVYYEMLEDPFPTDFGTMAQFLDFIAKVHASGVATTNGSRNRVEFDLEAYQQLETEYLAEISGF